MFSLILLDFPSSFSIDSDTLATIAGSAERLVKKPQNGIVHLAILDDERMRELNLGYRGIDATTDVLSFHYFDDFGDVPADEVAGEIVFSLSRIVSQAEEYGHSEKEELVRLAVHGILHILGYDHETDEDYETMWKIEEKILTELTG